jgi:hypothetical protein
MEELPRSLGFTGKKNSRMETPLHGPKIHLGQTVELEFGNRQATSAKRVKFLITL